MISNNKTYWAIHSDTERGVLTVWMMTVFLTSLVGDSLVLLGTTKYNAIKQHKITVSFLQHLAVCDLLQALFVVFPTALALAADKWILGSFLCHVQNFLSYIGVLVTWLLTLAMSVFKLVIIKFPLRTDGWCSARTGRRACAAMWVLAFSVAAPVNIPSLLYYRDTIFFCCARINS